MSVLVIDQRNSEWFYVWVISTPAPLFCCCVLDRADARVKEVVVGI